ncbi:hypothetical protein OGAPHI_001531 [Ogataea philodendri]|uniref:Cytosolic Fe-S cluster assembly factor NAR1 n=1 Tax=Ogataea philodendri TaxID=1378263 RepID=A0A9P8T8N7_9ASCO|nr:uncharacterized protein OGAPHI_001531 [Ogataea philodendri]KAH3669410.1 hypothetical protein OGAPHI_001531 [Ogataea philodendri]
MSAILSADDLNDFITPGVACVKPVESVNTGRGSGSSNTGGPVEIQIDSQGHALEVEIDGTSSRLQEAQISLADCLACSGCITSAEEVLVAQHSHKELINALKQEQDKKIFVMSISHQSRVSLALALKLTVEQTDKLLVHLFVNNLGFKNVVGTGLGRLISTDVLSQDIIQNKQTGAKGPVLTSICPGWVLYAEKTHPHILPRLSTVKSPQQITGCILKRLVSKQYGCGSDKVYHLSIMPCFDKKLEAARPEDEQPNETPDVDCVITPRELIQLLQDEKINIDQIISEIEHEQTPIEAVYERYAPNGWPDAQTSWLNNEGSSSGGYAYQYLLHLQKQHTGAEIQIFNGRNPDIYELRLIKRGEVMASAGVVNGFKNIQNLVRKLKNGSTKVGGGLAARRRARAGQDAEIGVDQGPQVHKCDLVEVMACPGGCINGGGQISGPTEIGTKEWLKELTHLYTGMAVNGLENNEAANWRLQFEQEYGISDTRMVRTRFKAVEKPTDTTSIALGSRW